LLACSPLIGIANPRPPPPHRVGERLAMMGGDDDDDDGWWTVYLAKVGQNSAEN